MYLLDVIVKVAIKNGLYVGIFDSIGDDYLQYSVEEKNARCELDKIMHSVFV